MLMDLDDGHTEEVEIGSHDEKDWHQEGENQVDVVVQPAIISTGKKIYLIFTKLEFTLKLLHLKPYTVCWLRRVSMRREQRTMRRGPM